MADNHVVDLKKQKSKHIKKLKQGTGPLVAKVAAKTPAGHTGTVTVVVEKKPSKKKQMKAMLKQLLSNQGM